MTKFVLFLLLIFCSTCEGQQRVLLRDVTSVTLKRGEYTTGRRSSSVPQLQCVGGTAYGKFSPKVVQCYNRGFDGVDVQWECKAEMPDQYEFGKITVSCEGYDRPNDPFILAGSCGLEYELDYSKKGVSGGYYKASYPEDKTITVVFYIVFAIVVLYIIYNWVTPRDGAAGTAGYGGDYPGGGGGGPDPPGWRRPPTAPPSYDDATKPTYSSSSSSRPATDGPGFWSGLGLGALGGYAANNFMNSGNAGTRRRATQFDRDTGYYQDDYDRPSTSGQTSSGTHTSSGFGGTSRR
ncbi:unnamed protein product [Bursaphelenchus xylophilus]|uniref:Store-operated calcium entry-associated regulatory factor n=1 Tax=Bursaphelenchus xylophilus TaxID=6326 RepID=A0A1I7SVR4_BURXY|nr:unnamed protein product [Bursaphelenchus xylophilus]CAG9098136.1 unnamed protein product [Bursaphelenchus xylophilus]